MSKRLLVVKSIGIEPLMRKTVADILFTGYGTTGIKTARTLYRLLYGTWDYYFTMCH